LDFDVGVDDFVVLVLRDRLWRAEGRSRGLSDELPQLDTAGLPFVGERGMLLLKAKWQYLLCGKELVIVLTMILAFLI